MDGPFKYKAFISYAHRDKPFVDWLHRALETYRVRRRLIGSPGRDGPTPARLFPIFRDREELPSASDLGGELARAMEASARLIVICTPHAVHSHRVDEEILAFKRMGREDRILAVIVEGEPNAEDPGLECFPRSLRFSLAPGGALSNEPAEPLAADARPEGDGREGGQAQAGRAPSRRDVRCASPAWPGGGQAAGAHLPGRRHGDGPARARRHSPDGVPALRRRRGPAQARGWPDEPWSTWRYRRATLARLLARDGMTRQVDEAYDQVVGR